jgi:hypothetical protein
MAVWQYDMHLIPRERVMSMFYSLPARLEPELWESVDWWRDSEVGAACVAILDAAFPRYESWDASASTWGSDNGDHIAIRKGDEQTTSVFLRIDVLRLTHEVLASVVRFASCCDCVVLTEDLRLLEPDLETLSAAIRQSPAFRFVQDPQRLLSEALSLDPESGESGP